MGQKINPNIFRLGVNKTWKTEFFEKKAHELPLYTFKDLEIKSYIEDDIFIIFNEFELQRLCDNNISNAIKYSYINETISVRLYRKDNHTVFEVENKGDKIVEIDKLFQRYYREDGARGGFGLGLNIVHEICENNKVEIKVISDERRTLFKYCFESSRRIA